MKKFIIGLLLFPANLMCVEEQWLMYTYRNELDNPVKIITEYTQLTQRFVQPRKRRKVSSKKIHSSVAHTLEPHESKKIVLKGDGLSAHRLIPGNIRVFDTSEHDRAVVSKYNAQHRNTFTVCRNKRDKLTMYAQR